MGFSCILPTATHAASPQIAGMPAPPLFVDAQRGAQDQPLTLLTFIRFLHYMKFCFPRILETY